MFRQHISLRERLVVAWTVFMRRSGAAHGRRLLEALGMILTLYNGAKNDVGVAYHL